MITNNIQLNKLQAQITYKGGELSAADNTDLIRNTKPDEFVPENRADSIDEKPKKKGFSKKVAGALLAATGLVGALVFVIRKNQTSKIQNIAENIEFKKAKTLEEAIEFGKKTFGIKEYSGFEEKDTDIVNWINEGIVNVSNRMHGKLRIPKNIVYTTNFKDNALAGVMPYTSKTSLRGHFGINKNVFSDIDSAIKNEIEKGLNKTQTIIKEEDGTYKAAYPMFDTSVSRTLLNKISNFKNGEITKFNDKVAFFENIKDFNLQPVLVFNSPYVKIKQIAEGLKIAGKKADIDLESIKNKPLREQQEIFIDLIHNARDTAGIKIKFVQNELGPFSTVYHEMGHLQDMVKRVKSTEKFDSPDKYPEELKKWLNNTDEIQIANNVSPYAATGPREFIAETFAYIIDTGKVSDDVMKLYEKLNGPKIPA